MLTRAEHNPHAGRPLLDPSGTPSRVGYDIAGDKGELLARNPTASTAVLPATTTSVCSAHSAAGFTASESSRTVASDSAGSRPLGTRRSDQSCLQTSFQIPPTPHAYQIGHAPSSSGHATALSLLARQLHSAGAQSQRAPGSNCEKPRPPARPFIHGRGNGSTPLSSPVPRATNQGSAQGAIRLSPGRQGPRTGASPARGSKWRVVLGLPGGRFPLWPNLQPTLLQHCHGYVDRLQQGPERC